MNLILDQYGVKLGCKDRAFVIFSKLGSQKIAPSKIKSITANSGALISSDAMLLAIDNGIDIQICDGTGHPVGRIWSHKYGSISSIRKQQLVFSKSDNRFAWVATLLAGRLADQRNLLHRLMPDRPAKRDILDQAKSKIAIMAEQVTNLLTGPPVENMDASLRGYEGSASQTYFKTLSQIMPSAYTFARRSRLPAQDMFNCTLNYLYGILYGRVENALIRAGLDPYIGLFHRDDYNKPVFVYDFIEQYRLWAEEVVLHLCFRRALTHDMFSTKNDGFWLEKEGRQLVIFAMNEHLYEVIQANNRRRTRLNHIQEDAHSFAQHLLSYGR